MGLQIAFHLQTVFHVAQEAIGSGQQVGFFSGKQLILNQLFKRRKRLRYLEERVTARMKQLQRLGDEFDLAYAASAKLDVSLELASFQDFIFNALFDSGDFVQDAFVD